MTVVVVNEKTNFISKQFTIMPSCRNSLHYELPSDKLQKATVYSFSKFLLGFHSMHGFVCMNGVCSHNVCFQDIFVLEILGVECCFGFWEMQCS